MKNISPRKYYRRICAAIKRDYLVLENKSGRKSWKLQARGMAGLAGTAMREEELTVEQRAVAALNDQGCDVNLDDVGDVRIVRVVDAGTVELETYVSDGTGGSYTLRFRANCDFYNVAEA